MEKKKKNVWKSARRTSGRLARRLGRERTHFFPRSLSISSPTPAPADALCHMETESWEFPEKIQKIKLRFEPPTTARFHFWVLGLFVIWIASGVGCSAAPKHHQPVNQSSVKKIQDSKIKDSVYLPFYLKYELFIYKNYTSCWSVYAQLFFFCWNINCYVCFHPRVALTRD